MNKQLAVSIFGLTLVLAHSTIAQTGATVTETCAEHLNTSPEPEVGALLNCLVEMQRAINRLETRITSAPTAADVRAVLPKGTVIAVDDPSGCPQYSGWSLVQGLVGRVIVGAATDENAEYHYNKRAGKAKYTLSSVPEHRHTISPHAHSIPNHNHDQKGAINGQPYQYHAPSGQPDEYQMPIRTEGGFPENWDAVLNTENGGPSETGSTGRSVEYDVMQPYVALYLCKYDGIGRIPT